MGDTKIEWATHTENYQAGCTKVSPACENCYAMGMSARLERMDGPERYAGVAVVEAGKAPRWTGRITPDLEAMRRIFQGLVATKKPRRVFLNSMTDTFHKDVPEVVLAELATCLSWDIGRHVVMLLTKRPDRLLAWQRKYFPEGLPRWVWVGCTVEDQRRAERISWLVQVRASVRFLSMEPLLGPVELSDVTGRPDAVAQLGKPAMAGISWVITGGESGPKARPSHPAWFRSLQQQCSIAGVPFFMKQLGGHPDKRDEIDGFPEDLRLREVPS